MEQELEELKVSEGSGDAHTAAAAVGCNLNIRAGPPTQASHLHR
jgi:hypothetical protein